MKKIKVLLAAVILTGLTLTSCSSDDDGGTSASIIGKWTPTKTVTTANDLDNTVPYNSNEPGCSKDYVEFVETGGVFRNVVYNKDTNDACIETAADNETYTKTDNTVTINGGEFEGSYTIDKLTGSELRVSASETIGGSSIKVTRYFTKVNE